MPPTRYKFGLDWQHVYDERIAAPQWIYTFPTIASYQLAQSGVAPFGYSTLTQITGDLGFKMSTDIFSGFVQDDWQVAAAVKVLYGLRYDLYKYPEGLADAPLEQTRSFNIDTNNFGPRAGVAWAVNSKSVVRGSMGMMFDQPILGGYEQALQLSGSPRAPIYTFNGTSAGAPAFPNSVSSGTVSQQSPWAVDPEFQVARTWQSNVQYERSFGQDLTASVSLMYAKGYQLPVVTDVNLINPVSTLADGRPVYLTAVNANTRLDPRFNHINEVQSIGDSTFKSMTLQVNQAHEPRPDVQRASTRFGKGTDNTPLLTQLTVQSENGRSDPTQPGSRRGPESARHAPQLHRQRRVCVREPFIERLRPPVAERTTRSASLLLFNSGLPINIPANSDLNGDGIANNDRPAFVGRNSLYMPVRRNVDLRYTRWFPIRGSVRGEVIAELKNVFNIEQLQTVTTTTRDGRARQPSGADSRRSHTSFRIRRVSSSSSGNSSWVSK